MKQFIQTNNYNTCCQIIAKYGGVIVKLYVSKFDLFVRMLEANIFQDYIMSLCYWNLAILLVCVHLVCCKNMVLYTVILCHYNMDILR